MAKHENKLQNFWKITGQNQWKRLLSYTRFEDFTQEKRF